MTSYVPILQDDERKKVRSLEFIYLVSLTLVPVQFILMGVAIWKGFFHMDNSFFYIALPITFVILLIQFLSFDRLSKKINSTLGELNPLMWERLTQNVENKYGEYGTISPLDNPEDVSPADGSSTNKSGKVLWIWKDTKETETFKVSVDKATGEPTLKNIDQFVADGAQREPASTTEPTTSESTRETEPTTSESTRETESTESDLREERELL